jgi:hypothetical protein
MFFAIVIDENNNNNNNKILLNLVVPLPLYLLYLTPYYSLIFSKSNNSDNISITNNNASIVFINTEINEPN